MDKAPLYERPLLGVAGIQDDASFWDVTMKAHEEGRFTESLNAILMYMNPSMMKDILKRNPTEFTIPHGSMNIQVSIKDGFYEVKAPFLRVPEKRAVVLLRQIAEINFSTLVLSQIRLIGNELMFYFKAPVELSFPYKVWDVFYEICINADYYDDLFINDLGAERVKEMNVTQYSAADMEKHWQKYHAILDETITYVNYFQTKRWTNMAIDGVFIGLMKLDYFLQPQGMLRTEIERVLYYNQDISAEENSTNLYNGLMKIKNLDRSIFDNSVYITSFLIPPKRRADLNNIKEMLQKDYDQAGKDISAKNYMSAADFLLYTIYNLLYRYMIAAKTEAALNTALTKASGQTWEDAADILYKAVAKIMESAE